MQEIFVYGKEHCGQCNVIKNKLTNMKVPFQYVCDESITMNKARELLDKDLLIEMTMPIIIKGEKQIAHKDLEALLN
jgi:glutaredoxin